MSKSFKSLPQLIKAMVRVPWGKSREVGEPTVKLKWPESNYCQSQTKQNVAVNLKAS